MPIELLNHQVPQTITWFNNFVGFRELHSRLEKVETKLRAIDFASPTLNARYFFHMNYKRIIYRNRLCLKLPLENGENYRPISFAASVRDAANQLSEKGRSRLRAQIIDALSPDGDFRRLEHEIRVYTHYRQLDCQIKFADLEGVGNHDFTIYSNGVEFEVEAKTVNEDVGNLVSAEDSVTFFKAYKAAIQAISDFRESGFFTYHVRSRPKSSYTIEKLIENISDLLRKPAIERDYGDATLSFHRKDDWGEFVRRGNFAPIRQAIAEQHERENPHAMVVLGKGQVVMFCVKGARPIRLFKGIRERLKQASNQLSGTRPGLIWMHFLGLDEPSFISLRGEAEAGQNNAFTSFGRYVFDSENRKHVCRVRLSGEAGLVASKQNSAFLGKSKTISQSGPAFDMVSNVSRYNPEHAI